MAMTWFQKLFTPEGSGSYQWQGRPDQGGGEFTGEIEGVYEGDEQDLTFMPQAYTAQTGDGNPVGELDKLADRLEGMASGIGGAPMLKNPRITNWQVPPIFNRGWDANEFSAPGPWDRQLSGMDQLSPNRTGIIDTFMPKIENIDTFTPAKDSFRRQSTFSVSPETSVEHPILAKYVDSRPAYQSSHVVPSTVQQTSTSVGGPSTVTNLKEQLATVRENRANQDPELFNLYNGNTEDAGAANVQSLADVIMAEKGLPVGHGQDDDAGMRSVENFNNIRAMIQAEKDRKTREGWEGLSIDEIVNYPYGESEEDIAINNIINNYRPDPSEEDIAINNMIDNYRPGPWNKTEEEMEIERILARYYPVQDPGPMGPYMKHSGPEMWRQPSTRGANYPRGLF